MRGLPRFIARSYLRKFAAITAVTLILVGGTAVYAQDEASTHLESEKHREMGSLARLEADRLAGWVAENRQNARMLSSMKDFQGYSDERVTRKLIQELDALPESTQAIHHLDLQTNTVLQSTEKDSVGQKMGHIVWRTEGQQTSTGLTSASGSGASGLVFDTAATTVMSEGYERGGKTLIAFASKVPGRNTALVLTVDTDTRAAQFEQPIEGSVTDVVADDGTVMLSTVPNHTLASYAPGTETTAIQRALEGETGALDVDDAGQVRAYAPVEGTDWVVVTAAPQSGAYALRTSIQRDLALVGGIGILGLIVVGLTLGRGTARELDRLADEAHAVAEGDLDVEITGTDRADEVGRVSRSFAAVQAYLGTASRQADAIAAERFDDPALDEEVPGEFGETLDAMAEDVETLIDDVERARNEAETLTRSLETQAAAYGETMARAAEGDLTQRMEADVESRAMVAVAESFNEMLAEFETTVAEVQETAEHVDENTASAEGGVDEVERAGEEVATSTQEISAAVLDQSDQLADVRGEMAALSATVEEVAATANEVAAHSADAAERGREGAVLADDALDELEAIERRSKQTAETVARLEAEIGRIDDIVEVIDGIAEQTNVLALNASVEAARAGSAGDGFAVVAEEVKKLAMETREATGEIADRIDGVQTTTEDAVEEMDEMREGVDAGVDTVGSALTALDEVVEAVETANDEVQAISDATDEQATTAEAVVAMADEAADLGEGVSADTQSVSAAAEEQAASLAQVSEEVRSVSRRARDLRSLTAAFETNTAAEGTGWGDAADTEPTGDDTQPPADDALGGNAAALGDGGFVRKSPTDPAERR